MEDTLTIPEQPQTEEQPQQQDPPSKKLYDGLVQEKLYSKTYDDFIKQYNTPEQIEKLHNGLVEEKLYSKTKDDFVNQYFPESKKKVSSNDLPPVSDNGSSTIQKVKEVPQQKMTLEDFGIKPPIIPKEQQVNQPTSTEAVQPKVAATYADFRDNNAVRKEKHSKLVDEAIDNTAKKVLKNKGVIKPEEEGKALNISQYSQLSNEKKRLQDAYANGDATFAISKDGEVGLNKTIGWWDALTKGYKKATQGNDEAAAFAGMDAAQKVDYLKKKEAETPVNPNPEYLGERGSALGSIGGLVGGNAPFLAKAAIGGAVGTGLATLAPATGGLSLEGLPAATAFIFTANDSKNQGIQQEVTRRFYQLKKENPTSDDVSLMKEAEKGALVGGLAGIGTNAALMTGIETPLSNMSKGVVGKSIAKAIGNSVYGGAATAGIEGAKLAEGNLEGIKAVPSDIAKEMGKTFAETATTLGILHVMTGAVTGAINLPKTVRSAMKYALKDENPQVLTATLKANEEAGKIPEGTTDKVMGEINAYKDAVNKTVSGLSPEAEASVAGLIEQKTKLLAEQKTKDSSAKPYYDEKIAGIDEQIQKTINTGKPYAHEIDEMSGNRYTSKSINEPVSTETEQPKGQEGTGTIPTSSESNSAGTEQVTAPVSGIVTEPPISFPEPTLIGKNEETKAAEVVKPEAQASPTDESINPTVTETGEGTGGGKEPPKVTPIEGDGKGEDWTAIRKEKQREIKAVKDAYEKQGVKTWSKTLENGLEKTQKLHPDKNLYDAALTTMHNIRSGAGHGDLTTDEALATMQYLKRELGQKRSQLADAVTSDNDMIRQSALMQDEALGRDYENTALAIKDITTTAGRTLNYAQSELRLDPQHGLQIRRMQLLRSKNGEPLTPEEMKWTKYMWDKEMELRKQEENVRSQKMKDDFDNRISELQKEYEQKLKEAGKNTPVNRAKNTKTLSQKGKGIADQIRKLKTDKNDLNLDVTFGLRNLAIEGVAQLVEKGATVAEAIKEVLKDVKFKGLSENELTAHIVDGITNKKDKGEQLEKIKDFIKKNGETDITNEMVTNNLIRDYVNSHIGEVEKSKVFETAFDDLKKVLPDLTKEKLRDAYLKEGEFKPTTKSQLEGGIKDQQNELRRIAKKERTADQEQAKKLADEKKNTLNKIKEYRKKIAEGDFSETTPLVKLNKQDAELIKLKKNQSILEEQYRKKQEELKIKNKSALGKGLGLVRAAYVATLIGKMSTLGRVAAMSVMRPTSEIIRKQTLGPVFDAFFPGISKVAERGGEGHSLKQLKSGFYAYFKQRGADGLAKVYENANSKYEAAKKELDDYKKTNDPSATKIKQLQNNVNGKLVDVQGSFIYQFIGGSSVKDALQAFVNRSNEIEKQFGHVQGESIKDGDAIAKLDYILGFIGRSHSALKTFSGRFSFASGFMARLEGAVKNGEDITSGDKILEIAHESYLDWERGKYQQSNLISDLWNKAINGFEKGEIGASLAMAKAAKYVAQADVAITRVPVNILHEAIMEYTLGAFRVAGLFDSLSKLYPSIEDKASIPKLMKGIKSALENDGFTKGEKTIDGITYGTTKEAYQAALKDMINQMDSKQAATIARAFTKGSIGIGMYALALISGAIHFGIFPHLGQKKKKDEKDLALDELNPGQIMVGNNKLGESVSAVIEHAPVLWPTFFGLGMAQAYNDQIKKGKSTKEAVEKAIYTHLKIIEGSIPQSNLISPTKVAEKGSQLVQKRLQESGILQKDEYKGFTKDQLKSDEFSIVKDKGLKIPAPPKRQGEKFKDNYESPEDYEKFTEERARRITDGLKQLKEKGLTEGSDYNNAVKDMVKDATEDARLKVFGIKPPKEKSKSFINNYERMPVEPK